MGESSTPAAPATDAAKPSRASDDPPAALERLVTLAMPFGKYKGTLLADLPSAYLDWFGRQGFPKGELGRLLALMHEVDQAGGRPLLAPLRHGAPKAQAK